ncbi:hypothetical protein AJ78_04121 [Emergomyces pasteurianus Ep9510]|uniref:DUF7371 domain-containing protein n=1 Tax=Emergomyces pasteurianus Ep9510 TaxID=1447872 RepID=A0A1J9QK89_9EURO|nr:hypothetical protein AJ78_04121 [Emergomyces pasteurianus Ep9510]
MSGSMEHALRLTQSIFSWNGINDQIVTITTTVPPKFCASTETNTNDQVVTITTTVSPKTCASPDNHPLTTTVTETVYITLTLYVSPVGPRTSSACKNGLACAASTRESKLTEETFVTYTKTASRSETEPAITNAGSNDVSSQRSTLTMTVYPIPVSEYTTIVTSISTETISLPLTDVPWSTDFPVNPVPPPPSTKADLSTTSTPIASFIPTTLSAVPSKPYGPSGWNFTNSATATAQGTGVQAVSGRFTPESSQPAVISITKRQVGAMVSATINGQIVSWINKWDGGALPSAPPSSGTPIIEINRTAISTPSSIPTMCGESGEFTMDFDDLPRYSLSNNNTASFPPIFNPYNHLFFSDGWSYGPPPTEPYPPASNPHIGIYVPDKNKDNRGSPYAGLLSGGEFGAGPRSSLNTFWFDAYSAYFGCDNGSANTTCAVTVSAVRYSTKTNAEEAAETRKFTLPPCPGYKNCTLSPLDFGDSFRGISGLQFSASVQDKPVILFVDDIKMNWYNNTCAAGLERLRSR